MTNNSNTDLILNKLETICELLRELLDIEIQGLENQRHARKISEENQVEGLQIIPIFKKEK
jgi:hypothetical protein